MKILDFAFYLFISLVHVFILFHQSISSPSFRLVPCLFSVRDIRTRGLYFVSWEGLCLAETKFGSSVSSASPIGLNRNVLFDILQSILL